MIYRYAEEKLSQAIWSLTNGPGDARERLGIAYGGFHTLTKNDFPSHLWKEYKWVLKMLDKKKFPADDPHVKRIGAVEANLEVMRNLTASKIIQRLQSIYAEVQQVNYEST